MPASPADAHRAAAWRGVRRLLAVRLDNLGDVLMTTPALAALRAGLPGVSITLLASRAGAALAPHLADVDGVWAHDASWLAHAHPATATEEMALVGRIAEHGFDAAVVFTVCTQSALPAALLVRSAGIPLRLAHSRENPYALLTDWVREPDTDLARARHEVQRQLDLVSHIGVEAPADTRLRFALRAADTARVDALLHDADVDPDRPLVVVHPGASAASRRWPAERFGDAAARLAACGAAVVFTGSTDEQALVDAARARMQAPAPSLAGRLRLGELAALIARASVLVANNSGPVHLAAALATPVVDLYALTNPQHTPWQVPAAVLNHDVPCRNCLKSVCPQGHHDCLRQVPAQAAADAALPFIGATP